MQAAALAGIALIFTGFVFGIDSKHAPFEDIYQVFYMMLLILTGTYFASRSFVEYKSTSTGFSYMMLPASTFEKFLIPAFFSGIFYWLIFTIFYVALAWLSNLFWGWVYQFDFYLFNPFSSNLAEISGIFFVIFLILQPLFLYGSIAFRKNHFVVTGIWIFGILMIFLLTGLSLHKTLNPDVIGLGITFSPTTFQEPTVYIIAFIIHLILQMAVFYKLKEKEV